MKKVLFMVIFLLMASNGWCADKYVRAAGGNFNTAATWATTSGGTEETTVPGGADNVFVDSNSGNLVMDSMSDVEGFNMTGYTGTMSGTGDMTIYSSTGANVLLFAGTVTWNGDITIKANSGSSITVTMDGHQITGSNYFNVNTSSWNTGAIYLEDNFGCTATTSNGEYGSLYLDGASDDNGNSHTWYAIRLSAVQYLGDSTQTITRSSTSYGYRSSTASVTTGTSLITFTGADSYFSGTGGTFGDVTFNNTSGSIVIPTSATYDTLTIGRNKTATFTDGTTQTVSSFVATGTSGNEIVLTGSSTAGWDLSDSTGTNAVEYCTIDYSTAGGGATWNALTTAGNTDGGNNSGWTFTSATGAPPQIW